MNKDEFFSQLSINLNHMPKEEREDILSDYEEHFRIGHEDGRTEEEIAEALGNPHTIAKQLKGCHIIRDDKNTPSKRTFGTVFTAIVLIFFNLVFTVGIFAGMIGIIIGLFAVAIGVAVSGVALFFGTIFQPILSQFITIYAHPVVSIFSGIGLTALGILFFIGDCYLSKWFYNIIKKYVKMNLNIINNRRVQNEK